jgi:hypothetical protein
VHVGAVSGAAAHSLAAVAHKVAYVTLAASHPIFPSLCTGRLGSTGASVLVGA